ncbi:unnamed protein product [Adineta steineri]|uniref:Inositol polyphosphate-related phosphatase domain-containing protein n=1 Tax=Adineta steineri TaxID=433720 RepID=A0A813YV95_9BILA|nr:unnamed protein product [Adineta steineri]CAF1165398.1 unnamed protein product [Adineta steineri]
MSNSPKRLEIRLKEREDEYICYKQFSVLVGTFNVNNRQAPTNILLEQWLYQVTDNDEETKEKYIPDIIAVGFQEIDTSGGAYIYDDKKKEDEWEHLVQKTIKSCYGTNNKENIKYELLNRVRLIGILLFVYVRSTHVPKCTLISRASVPTGFMGLAGNKGGVGIRFRFYETDICFVNSHFASGDGQTNRRNDDYQKIESGMAFTDGPTYSFKDYIWYTPTTAVSSAPNPATSNQWWKISDHDIIFWCGDMNYRISQPNEQVRKAINELSTVPLHEKDQLRCEMKLNNVFSGYYEPPIDFMPTYKFDINTDTYDTSEKLRTPSWTDRILYRPKRSKVLNDNQTELESIKPIHYLSANNIKFSDHRPVSGLYSVVIKYECDEKRSSRIREELIREFDRLENDSIPTIEVEPRPPEIKFNHIRYLDKPTYTLKIKNIGECSCLCSISPSSISPSFQCLTFTPNQPYTINVKQEQYVNINFNAKFNVHSISEILILHVENGADTFITLDVTFDHGPFGLALNEYPSTFYDRENKKYIYTIENKFQSEHIVEMINDPPILYISLIDCLKERDDLNLISIFNNDTQDSLDLLPLRDQLYENNFDFTNYSTAQLFMILLHLLQSLRQPLISFEIQDKIFRNRNDNLSKQDDMTKAISIIVEQMQGKERNLFFRLLLLLQKCWPTKGQIEKIENESGDILNICIDILALSILHEHLDRNQRRAFILACLNEENKN